MNIKEALHYRNNFIVLCLICFGRRSKEIIRMTVEEFRDAKTDGKTLNYLKIEVQDHKGNP